MNWRHTFGLIALATLVAGLAPEPWWQTDRDLYVRVSQNWYSPQCADVHCFRPLVPWILGFIPGPTTIVWKAYAVACQVGAGLLMALWVRRWGANAETARMVAWLTTLGSGACYTLFEPFTADPLMHLLAPASMLLIDRDRRAAATSIAAVGVLGKEFAAVPIAVGAAYAALRKSWGRASDLAIAFVIVFTVWASWQAFSRLVLGYSNGWNYSDDFAQGSYIVKWLDDVPPVIAASVIAMTLGGLWLLWGASLFVAPREVRQLTIAALPAVVVFNVVQQPDRALWNFAFVIMPAAALLLNRVPPALGWTFVIAQVMLNLRFGAQLMFIPTSRLTLTVALLAAAAIVYRSRAMVAQSERALHAETA